MKGKCDKCGTENVEVQSIGKDGGHMKNLCNKCSSEIGEF